MLNKLFSKTVLKKAGAISLGLIVNSASALVYFSFPQSTPVAYADTACRDTSVASAAKVKPRVGGVALDQAAKFLANMNEVTGAYYDQTLDRIVFVGKTNTSLPQFDKDDLAVAIKVIIFEGKLPWFSLESNATDERLLDSVFGSNSLVDTRFGKVMYEADYQMKLYGAGKNVNGQPITSTVPGYKSFRQMYLDYGPTPGSEGRSRWWFTPQYISLKKDDANSAFVFDSVKMQIKTEALANNDPAWNRAANDFAQHQTDHYDEFTQESPSYGQLKQLGKMSAVVKWIYDSGVTTDFHWARDYAPKKVQTPRTTPKVPDTIYTTTDGVFTYTEYISGGADLATANTYTPDTGTSAALKASAQAVPTTQQDVTWNFTKDGQQYQAVAVEADAFRSVGSYNTAETDFSTPIAGDMNLTFQRIYSSFSAGQYGVGRGWNIFPAQLFDIRIGQTQVCGTGLAGTHPKGLGFKSQSGGWESFVFQDCAVGYMPEDNAYHSKITHNGDGTFTATLKDQTQFIFDSAYKLTQMKDKNANKISYSYDAESRLTSITDNKSHPITFAYNAEGLITSATDWAGRKVTYTYDAQGNLLTATDPNNGVSTYNYDANFKLISIVDRNGQTTVTNTYTPESKMATQKNASDITATYAYDNVNRQVTVTDSLGRITKNKYDTKARVLEGADPANQLVKYTYGAEFAPLTITDKKGNKVTNTYDPNGNLLSTLYPDNSKINYTYDSKNRVTKIDDYRYGLTPKATTFTYDAANNLSKIDEALSATNFTYDTTGEVLTVTDPLLRKTTYTRDSLGNKLTETDPLLNKTTYDYDLIGRLLKQTDPDLKVLSYTYDGNGNVLTTINAAGSTTNIYDKENRLVKTTLPTTAMTEYVYSKSDSLTSVKDAVNSLTTYGYDAYQNLISQQDALNQTTVNTYDNLNRQKDSTTPLGKVVKWEYDANGNLTKRIDANAATTTYTYDVLNRLTKMTYPDLKTVSYEYDARGNMTKMTDPVGVSMYTYDAFDRLTKATNPYNHAISYTYDKADNLTKLTYPDSTSVTYTYDNAHRLVKVTDWGGRNITYTYNKNNLPATRTMPNTVKTTYGYDLANRLVDISHTKSTTTLAKFTYERDSVGNITKASESGTFVGYAVPTPTPTPTATPTPTPTPGGSGPDLVITNVTTTPATPVHGQNFTISTTFQNQGTATANMAAMRVAFFYDNPTAPNYQTTYNDFNNISVTLAPGMSQTYNHVYGNIATAGPHTIWVMVDYTQGIVESNENNNLFGPKSVSLSYGNVLQDFLAKVANTNPFKVGVAYAQTAPFVTNFNYDPLSRLTQASYPDGGLYKYTFDKVDNRATATVGTALTNYTYNADSQLAQGGNLTYYYDNNGNQIQRTQTGLQENHKYTWDFENRLVRYVMPNNNTHNYIYDGKGNLLEKEFSTAKTRYVTDISGSLSRMLGTASAYGSGGMTDSYVYGLSMVSQGWAGGTSSTREYLLEDGLGNIRFITGSSGDKKLGRYYDPFGNVRKNDGVGASLFQFSGEMYNDTLGYHFLRARYYDPQTGRFISKDPVKGVLTIPQTQNPYAYAGNNPINMSDPSGEFWGPLLSFLGQVGTFMATKGQQACTFVATQGQKAVQATKGIMSNPQTANTVTNVAPKAVSIERKAEKVIHGNNLLNPATNYGYSLRSNATDSIMKFGETLNPSTRYPASFYKANDVYMKLEIEGSKADIHNWQNQKILDYLNQFGRRPLLNNSNF